MRRARTSTLLNVESDLGHTAQEETNLSEQRCGVTKTKRKVAGVKHRERLAMETWGELRYTR
jgi:hypothetical protein